MMLKDYKTATPVRASHTKIESWPIFPLIAETAPSVDEDNGTEISSPHPPDEPWFDSPDLARR